MLEFSVCGFVFLNADFMFRELESRFQGSGFMFLEVKDIGVCVEEGG